MEDLRAWRPTFELVTHVLEVTYDVWERSLAKLVEEQRRAPGHAPRPATGAEPAPLAAEGHQLLGMTGLAAHPQEPVLEATALQAGLEFLL
jgi:hypothetical protein